MPEKLNLPVVTIIIPNHNYGHYIMDAIDSVQKQDYPLRQLLIIDDGSTDGSFNQVASLLDERKDSEVPFKMAQGKYHNLTTAIIGLPECKGPSVARNIGIQAAWKYTHLFAMLDADDEWYGGRLSKIVLEFLKMPDKLGAVYTDYDTLNTKSQTLIREFKEPYSRKRLLQLNIVHSGCVVNRLALEAVGLYDETLRVAEDYDLWLRISEKFLIHHIPESFMLVRATPENSSSTVSQQVWQESVSRVIQKCIARNSAS